MIRKANLTVLPEQEIFLLTGETHLNEKVYCGVDFSCKERIEEILRIKIDTTTTAIYMVPFDRNFLVNLLRKAEGIKLNIVKSNDEIH